MDWSEYFMYTLGQAVTSYPYIGDVMLNSKKDFEVVIEEAKLYNGIILIVDEIHRMNKDKQDILLSFIEKNCDPLYNKIIYNILDFSKINH